MRWVGHVENTGERRGSYGISMGQSEGHLEDLCIDGRITLKRITLKKLRSVGAQIAFM
jgi:hypothetical protein